MMCNIDMQSGILKSLKFWKPFLPRTPSQPIIMHQVVTGLLIQDSRFMIQDSKCKIQDSRFTLSDIQDYRHHIQSSKFKVPSKFIIQS